MSMPLLTLMTMGTLLHSIQKGTNSIPNLNTEKNLRLKRNFCIKNTTAALPLFTRKILGLRQPVRNLRVHRDKRSHATYKRKMIRQHARLLKMKSSRMHLNVVRTMLTKITRTTLYKKRLKRKMIALSKRSRLKKSTFCAQVRSRNQHQPQADKGIDVPTRCYK